MSELIHHDGPWRDVDQVEAATAAWVQWFNTERTHGSIDDLTPLELEQRLLSFQASPTEPIRAARGSLHSDLIEGSPSIDVGGACAMFLGENEWSVKSGSPLGGRDRWMATRTSAPRS